MECSIDGCKEKVYFLCSCNKHLCNSHSETHSSLFTSHDLSRIYRAVDRKIKLNLMAQAKAKITTLQEMTEKINEKVEQIKNTLDNFFVSWKVAIDEQVRYLREVLENLEEFDIILINESQNLAEEIGCLYSFKEIDFFDLEDYFDRMFKSVRVHSFPVKSLNQPIPLDLKLKILEKQGLFIEGVSSTVLSLAISQNDKLLCMGCLDKTIRIWETASFNQISVLKGHANRVLCLCFDEKNEILASGSRDHSIILWDLLKMTQISSLLSHGSDVTSVIFKSHFLFSSSLDKTVILWNVLTKDPIQIYTGSKNPINCLVVSNTLKVFVSASDDKNLIFWNTFSGCKEELKAHRGAVKALALTEDERFLASGSNDKSINIWNFLTRKLHSSISHSDRITSLYISQSFIISGSKDKLITCYDLINLQKTLEYHPHSGPVISVVSTGNSKKIFSSSEDQSVKIFDLNNSDTNFLFAGHCEAVLCIAATYDSKFILSGSRDDSIRVWSALTKKQEFVLEGHEDYVKALAVTGDSRFVVSGSLDNTIKVWDLKTRTLHLNLVGHNSAISVIAVTEDQEFLVTGGNDRNIIVWNLRDFSCSLVIKKVEELKGFMAKYQELVPFNFYAIFE